MLRIQSAAHAGPGGYPEASLSKQKREKKGFLIDVNFPTFVVRFGIFVDLSSWTGNSAILLRYILIAEESQTGTRHKG